MRGELVSGLLCAGVGIGRLTLHGAARTGMSYGRAACFVSRDVLSGRICCSGVLGIEFAGRPREGGARGGRTANCRSPRSCGVRRTRSVSLARSQDIARVILIPPRGGAGQEWSGCQCEKTLALSLSLSHSPPNMWTSLPAASA